MAVIHFNTYDTFDLLHYVALPSGLSVCLSLKNYITGQILDRLVLGKTDNGTAFVHPLEHTVSGDFVHFEVIWDGQKIAFLYASDGDKAALRITPLTPCLRPMQLCIALRFLWNMKGTVRLAEDCLIAESNDIRIRIRADGKKSNDLNVYMDAPCLMRTLDGPITVTTDNIGDADAFFHKRKIAQEERLPGNGAEEKELYRAIRAAVGWNTFYEPNGNRIITGVSRDWNVYHGGYALFCWDSFFSALLAAPFSEELALANFRAILDEQSDLPFVPNSSSGSGFKTRDRSQPPVGTMVALKLFERTKNDRFLREVYPRLAAWNDWFWDKRQTEPGLFTWGSEPYTPVVGNEWETNGVGSTFGAALESGMDNSPLYDGVGWDAERNVLNETDAGLSALMIHDCLCLAKAAKILALPEEEKKFAMRAEIAETSYRSLWCKKEKMFLNRETTSSRFNLCRSAVHFYAFFHPKLKENEIENLLAHFFDEKEFWGEYMLASVSKDHPKYKNQNYWQGRIWPPHNYLVYEALKTYPQCAKARRILAEKSKKLLLTEWEQCGHIHENYNAETGLGCSIAKNNRIPGSNAVFGSDCLYNWGGLLALIALDEKNSP